jgi:hypothetical protein
MALSGFVGTPNPLLFDMAAKDEEFFILASPWL